MLFKKSESQKKKNNQSCLVFEYPLPSKKLGFATALINGRYPKKGKVRNLKSEEVIYVLKGSGEIYTTRGNRKVKRGDVYYLKAKESYAIKGKNLEVIIFNAPPFKKEEQENIN